MTVEAIQLGDRVEELKRFLRFSNVVKALDLGALAVCAGIAAESEPDKAAVGALIVGAAILINAGVDFNVVSPVVKKALQLREKQEEMMEIKERFLA